MISKFIVLLLFQLFTNISKNVFLAYLFFKKAFEILSMQLSNYDLQVFEKFHLITKSEHQNEKSILNNRDVIESLNSYAEEFLDL